MEKRPGMNPESYWSHSLNLHWRNKPDKWTRPIIDVEEVAEEEAGLIGYEVVAVTAQMYIVCEHNICDFFICKNIYFSII